MQLKSKTGSVSIDAYRGNWRIRLPRTIAAGKQHYIYSGLSTTSQNRRRVQIVALQIESDLESDRFDGSLEKYREALREIKGKKQLQLIPSPPNLQQLWSKYCEFKKSQVAKSTFVKDFQGRYASAIKLFPDKEIKSAIAIRDYLVANYPAYSAKRLITQINACCKWALKSGLIQSNPFEGLAADIKVKRWDTNDIDPFTPSERDAIIQAFESHPIYKHYSSFVKFLFITGCRIGEAIALRWEHINSKCSEIRFCCSYSHFGSSPTTKTRVSRKFLCNEQLRVFLTSIKPKGCVASALVFPSRSDGTEIKVSGFTACVWRLGIINKLVNEGKVLRYRPPYNCRATFISECLEKGVPVNQIAGWVGNSPEVIFKHYAGVIKSFAVPSF